MSPPHPLPPRLPLCYLSLQSARPTLPRVQEGLCTRDARGGTAAAAVGVCLPHTPRRLRRSPSCPGALRGRLWPWFGVSEETPRAVSTSPFPRLPEEVRHRGILLHNQPLLYLPYQHRLLREHLSPSCTFQLLWDYLSIVCFLQELFTTFAGVAKRCLWERGRRGAAGALQGRPRAQAQPRVTAPPLPQHRSIEC